MNLRKRQEPLLLGFLLFSLLLHLLLLSLLPQRDWFPAPVRQEPVVVELRPKPPPKPRERELDIPIRPELEIPRETPAKRLGPADQTVRKETAPSGDAPEDRRPDAPVPPSPARKPAQVAPPPKIPEKSRRQSVPVPPVAPRAERPADTGRPAQPVQPVQPEAAKPAPGPEMEMPDLQSLLQLPETTMARLDRQWRSKYRADVEEGNAVWLDMEKDLLISFFQRFRNNIYGVWNYPARARDRGEEGTCLLKITVNRDGTLNKVQLMETSGSSTLDDEAISAVRNGAPFGALPRSYKDEVLSIFAFFDYRLSRTAIY